VIEPEQGNVQTRVDQGKSFREKLLRKINAAVATMTATQTELVSRSKTVGVLLLEAKKLQ
jgi:hypothetical protein